MTVQQCGFVTHKIKCAFLEPLTCVICGSKMYGRGECGKLWDLGAGNYEFICQSCEMKILEESEVD